MLVLGAVYDVTRRETFDSLGEIWMQEVDMYRCANTATPPFSFNQWS